MVGNPETIQKRDSGKLGGNGAKSLRRMTQLQKKGDFPHEISKRAKKSRVPDTFQLGAILPFFCVLGVSKNQ
jgi:hypothetical protein